MSSKSTLLDMRKRVLILAFACSPFHGSELGVGWARAFETAKFFDTWVIYGEGEKDIKQWFSINGEIPTLHFNFVLPNKLETFLAQMPGLLYLAYKNWHRRAYRLAVKLNREIHFDLAHQVNWNTFREPGYLWKLDTLFIWGPVGGTQNYPWRFLSYAGIIGGLTEGIRSILNTLQFRLSRRVRKAAHKAALVLTANSEGKRAFERVHKINPVILLDVGVTEIINKTSYNTGLKKPLKILWSGVFQNRKALHLLLMALGKVPSPADFRIRILGDGPLKRRWKLIAQRYGIEQYITWMGWLSRAEAMHQYEWADVFVFTSLRDTCGTVVLEALSHGLPVICLDHQGAGDVVTSECGIKIPVTTPEETISNLREAIIFLTRNRDKLEALGNGALRQAQKYLWSVKGEQTAEIYYRVLKEIGFHLSDFRH